MSNHNYIKHYICNIIDATVMPTENEILKEVVRKLNHTIAGRESVQEDYGKRNNVN